MNYEGQLYGKVAGKFIPLELTTADVDSLQSQPPAKPEPRGDARDDDGYKPQYFATGVEFGDNRQIRDWADYAKWLQGRYLGWERKFNSAIERAHDAALLASSKGQGGGQTKIATITELICELIASEPEDMGPHCGYVTVQIDRQSYAEAVAVREGHYHPQPDGLREAAYNHAEVFHSRLVAAQEALEAYPAVVTEIINGYGIIVNEDQMRPYLADKLAQHIARAALAQADREAGG